MNKKIFTLLAVACLLFTTAYYVNARSVAEKSIGALVESLPEGMARGMYHIRVDSICLRDPATGMLGWYYVTYDDNRPTPTPGNEHLVYTGHNTDRTRLNYALTTTSTDRDTIVLAVTEQGEVIMISAKELREEMAADPERAKLIDLQAAMWCIEIERIAQSQWGNWPTFHFTSKIFDLDLDYSNTDVTFVDGVHRGWMFSQAHENGQLSEKHQFFRRDNATNGNYLALGAQFATNTAVGIAGDYAWNLTGRLRSIDTGIDDFVSDTVAGMLKLSIVQVSPLILSANEFNTKLGNTDGSDPIKLSFFPEPLEGNPFAYYLKAEESANPAAAGLGYLNVLTYDDAKGADYLGYVANKNTAGDQYNNKFSVQYLDLKQRPTANPATATGRDLGDYNYSYRFVYFPSKDSLVINAFYVKHNNHYPFNNEFFIDNGVYWSDGTGNPYYYGLYRDSIHAALIVRYQDLTGTDGPTSIMTIGEHPSNTRISMGVTDCQETLTDAWTPSKGVYTIWDREGRCLGVRIYNGTYSPQWIVLENDEECPDRIPSYQWTVEPSLGGDSKSRIDIYNREFGHLENVAPQLDTERVRMLRVLVRLGSHQIFKNQSQFNYNPLSPLTDDFRGYEPITTGWVTGQYLTPLVKADGTDDPEKCGTGNGGKGEAYSGFRPVINAYLEQATLGYKHFNVGQNPGEPDYGLSEDTPDKKGMDWNMFRFKYDTPISDNAYITLGERYGDILLRIENNKKTAFQFKIAQLLREKYYQEEVYGYPRGTGWSANDIKEGSTIIYAQCAVPRLKRFYYELKVADFYTYRTGMEEQYVVLKGGKIKDYADRNNAMIYGTANTLALKEPFKYANIYLRESLFIKKPIQAGEDRNKADQTRRILYAILDRIDPPQARWMTEEYGFEVSDTLYVEDGSTPFNLVAWNFDEMNQWVKARGKVASNITTSLFSLEYYTYPLYRRLRSIDDDGASPLGDGMDPELGASQIDAETGAATEFGTNLDAPKTLRIWTDHSNMGEYLYEDAMSGFSYNKRDFGGKQINFLGLNNIFTSPEGYTSKKTIMYNYNLFIDTAFINRGTGPIKPQYLIAVAPTMVTAQAVFRGINLCDGTIEEVDLEPYIYARYLVNATDSARLPGSNGNNKAPLRENQGFTWFIADTDWDRLVFVEAIHIHDRLYLISELCKALQAKGYDPDELWIESLDDGETYLNGAKLYAWTTATGGKNGTVGPLYGMAREYKDSKKLGVYYDFKDWDNYHNDVCFSLRFTHPEVQNPDTDGKGGSSNYEKRFYIESETTDRTPYNNRRIAPVQGGWILIQNGVPVLSRASYGDAIQQAEIFNVAEPYITDFPPGTGGFATQNENIGTIKVVAGDGFVNILNADGKQVKITNMLGQTLVNRVLAGNNEAVPVQKGIVIVSVKGEKAVKVIIK